MSCRNPFTVAGSALILLILATTPTRVLSAPPWVSQTLEPVQFVFDVVPTQPETGEPITLAQYIVPEDRLLAIEFASVSASASDAPDTLLVSIETTVGATPATYYLPLTIIFDSGYNTYTYSASQALRIYADQGTTVTVKGTILSACVDEPCSAIHRLQGSVSGHLLRQE